MYSQESPAHLQYLDKNCDVYVILVILHQQMHGTK